MFYFTHVFLLQEYNSTKPPQYDKAKATPEALVQATKAITLASTKTVAAGNSCKQIDISAAANLSLQAIRELLLVSKGAAYGFGQTEEQTQKLVLIWDIVRILLGYYWDTMEYFWDIIGILWYINGILMGIL